MSRIEYLTPEGFRQDGRRRDNFRHMCGRMIIGNADGTAEFEMGGTKVLAEVTGPIETRSNTQQGRVNNDALITVDVTSLPFANQIRQQARRKDKKLQDVASFVSNVLNSCIHRHKNPNTEISVFITVLAADGSLAACCLNAAYVALIEANIQMQEVVVGLSGGILKDQENALVVDLTHSESIAIPEFVLAVGEQSKIIYGLHYFHPTSLEDHTSIIKYLTNRSRDVIEVVRKCLIEGDINQPSELW